MKRKLLSNQFIMLKEFLNDRMDKTVDKLNNAVEENKSIEVCHNLKCKYWDLANSNTKIYGMRLRRF